MSRGSMSPGVMSTGMMGGNHGKSVQLTFLEFMEPLDIQLAAGSYHVTGLGYVNELKGNVAVFTIVLHGKSMPAQGKTSTLGIVS